MSLLRLIKSFCLPPPGYLRLCKSFIFDFRGILFHRMHVCKIMSIYWRFLVLQNPNYPFFGLFLLKWLLFRPKISNFIILVKVVIIKGPMLVTPDCISFIDFPQVQSVYVLLCQAELSVLDPTRAILAPKGICSLVQTNSSCRIFSSRSFSLGLTSVVATTVNLVFIFLTK